MTVRTGVLHNAQFKNGGIISLPPFPDFINLAEPQLHEYGTSQLYDLGTKYEFNDKVFRYCKADTGGNLYPHQGAGNKNAIALSYTTLSYPDADAATVAAAAGATSIYVVAASISKDEWKGGHVVVGHNSTATVQNRGIIGNDASATIAAVANVVKIDLDFPIQTALVAGTSGIEVSKSIYSNIKRPDTWHFTVIVVPCIYIATNAAQYFWGQTWGLCWMTPQATGFGDGTAHAGHEREVYFHAEGSLWENYRNYNGSFSLQRAGYIVDFTGAPEDTSLVFLQLGH